MARHKVLVIVPFPLTAKGMDNRRAQLCEDISRWASQTAPPYRYTRRSLDPSSARLIV